MENFPSNFNENLRKQKVLLKHILSMSAGLEWDEQTYSYDNPKNDWCKASRCDNSVKFVLQKPGMHPPGKQFQYNGGLTIMLSGL
ncbi:MAG: beta-lactamase family protein, partial [bacterium]|nr:beta-lactamase family protein [bacterium]